MLQLIPVCVACVIKLVLWICTQGVQFDCCVCWFGLSCFHHTVTTNFPSRHSDSISGLPLFFVMASESDLSLLVTNVQDLLPREFRRVVFKSPQLLYYTLYQYEVSRIYIYKVVLSDSLVGCGLYMCACVRSCVRVYLQ